MISGELIGRWVSSRLVGIVDGERPGGVEPEGEAEATRGEPRDDVSVAAGGCGEVSEDPLEYIVWVSWASMRRVCV